MPCGVLDTPVIGGPELQQGGVAGDAANSNHRVNGRAADKVFHQLGDRAAEGDSIGTCIHQPRARVAGSHQLQASAEAEVVAITGQDENDVGTLRLIDHQRRAGVA